MTAKLDDEKGPQVGKAAVKKPNVSGVYGVRLEPFRRLRTVVWVREVLRVAGGDPDAIAAFYKNNPPLGLTPELEASLNDTAQAKELDKHKAQAISEARALISSIPLLANNRKSLPNEDDFCLYVAGLREPTLATVRAYEGFRPTSIKSDLPLEDTASEFSLGPYGFRLWRCLNGDLTTCQEVIRDELLNVGKAFFKRNDFRWGVGFSVQIDFLYRVMISDPMLTSLEDQDDLAELSGGCTTYEAHAKAILDGVENAQNPVFDAFTAAMSEENFSEKTKYQWVGYFVVAMAIWQRCMVNGQDGFGLATIMVTGFLSAPLDKLFGISGPEIRDVAISKVIESCKKLGTDDKPSKRYLRVKNYLEPYLS